jgi:NADH:ubiquinone oxidoreductase subunit 3 (subunit A)
VNDTGVQLAVAAAFTAVSSYLLIRLVTFVRGHRPLLHPRLLSFFELGHEPPRVGRSALSFDVWVVVAMLVLFEFAAATLLIDGLAGGNIARAGLWGLHFATLIVWAIYLWRSSLEPARPHS